MSDCCLDARWCPHCYFEDRLDMCRTLYSRSCAFFYEQGISRPTIIPVTLPLVEELAVAMAARATHFSLELH